MKQVSKSNFRARALQLFREIEMTGQPVIVTDRGKPVLEVRPYSEPKDDPLASLRGSVLFYIDPDEPVGLEDWKLLR